MEHIQSSTNGQLLTNSVSLIAVMDHRNGNFLQAISVMKYGVELEPHVMNFCACVVKKSGMKKDLNWFFSIITNTVYILVLQGQISGYNLGYF